jgi:predicted glycoside hydrolase/deacetylase ChbG (UPF0249 family)
MKPNPYLKKLGLSDNDRAVIIHTDDIGMCQASVQAFRDLWAFGSISSGAVMVPCPWFPAVAQMCRENPSMDMGVHAVLNSEWEAYRWAPISGGEAGSGLMDEAGYFHQSREAVYENAIPEAVAVEVNAQVDKALAAGIDVTHIDSHMGTIINPKFVENYLQAGASRLIPNMLPRASAKGFDVMGIDEQALALYTPILEHIEAQGIPMLDGLFELPLTKQHDRMELVKRWLGELPTGITHFILHPSIDTPELRAITPDWAGRVADYQTFMSDEFKMFLEKENLKLIGYRQIRDAMRS